MSDRFNFFFSLGNTAVGWGGLGDLERMENIQN